MECGINPMWYNEDPAASSDLIYEEHNIPIYFEEEVVTIEDEEEPANISSYSVSESKYQKTHSVNRDHLKSNQSKSGTNTGSHTPSNSSFKPFVLNEHTMRIFKNKIKAIQKRRAQTLAREKKQRPKKIKMPSHPPTSFKTTLPAPRKQAITPATPLTPTVSTLKKQEKEYFHYKPKPSVDPSKSGEILRMQKVDSEDIEIDILSNSEDDDDQVPSYQMPIYPEADEDDSEPIEMSDTQQQYEEEYESGNTSNSSSIDEPDSNLNDSMSVIEEEHEDTIKKLNELRETDETTSKLVESSELPTEEMTLDPEEATPIEKFLLSEFFSGSPTKSPERYLKIRNHIIGIWLQCKPIYLSKTASRQGLKKCGDVNSISRIHLALENLGVINFGCSEVKYILPLRFLFGIFQQSIRNKNQSYARTKHDSFSTDTIDTSPSGVSSNDTMVNRIKSRTQSRTQFELIKCQRYSKENVAPFEISITLSCLLCLYFHALSSKLEIMGFLGGHIDKSNGRSKISLKCYKPCRTSISTSISAEMCPVSQVEQSSDITQSGFELLGWFHSHPTFPATPSRTDLKTQNEIQMQFAPNNPFIGFILSCLQMDFK